MANGTYQVVVNDGAYNLQGTSPTTGEVYLGSSSADPDPDSQESADAGATITPANGDDNDGNDDDEGVIQTPARDWFNGANGASVTITGVSSNCTEAVPCFLSAWIDWDEGGSFGSSERVLVD